MKKIIETSNAPLAIGPYSQAILVNNTLYVSGQLPINPLTNTIDTSVSMQTKQSLNNILEIAHSAGFQLDDIIKCTVYLKDMNTFAEMNHEYANFFTTHTPARVTVEVARLPKDALVEIDAICAR